MKKKKIVEKKEKKWEVKKMKRNKNEKKDSGQPVLIKLTYWRVELD